jgi:hypothetical protein
VTRRNIIAMGLAIVAGNAAAGWSPAWTNGSVWASYAMVKDIKAAVDERHVVMRPYAGDWNAPPAAPGIWPSVRWLGVIDLWLYRTARLLRAPSENSASSSANCSFLDPYLASGTSYEAALRTNAEVRLTWTNAMRYAGLTNTFNFTRPIHRYSGGSWSMATNRPFWLRREDLDERRRVLNLLRWTRETQTVGGTNVHVLASLPNAFESPSFPSCDLNAPVQELPAEYAWTNAPSGDAAWTLDVVQYEDDPIYVVPGHASRMDGIGRSDTGNVAMVILDTFEFEGDRFPNISWPSNYYVAATQPTNFARAMDLYARWETNVLAAVDTYSPTKLRHDNRPRITSYCARDWSPSDFSEPRTNSQPTATWSLPLAYTLEATAATPRGTARSLARSGNVPDYADLVLTHRKHSFLFTKSGVTNTIEQLAVVAPVWQADIADPANGPDLDVVAVCRWDVTNGFDKVGPLP